MAVKAKFYVAEVTKRSAGRLAGYAAPIPLGHVILRPSTGEGNEEWASSTPSGSFEMTVRGEALNTFEALLGQDVSITIEPFSVSDVPAES